MNYTLECIDGSVKCSYDDIIFFDTIENMIEDIKGVNNVIPLNNFEITISEISHIILLCKTSFEKHVFEQIDKRTKTIMDYLGCCVDLECNEYDLCYHYTEISNLKMLKYIRTHNVYFPRDVCEHAKNLACLQYLISIGCDINSIDIFPFVSYHIFDCFEYMYNHASERQLRKLKDTIETQRNYNSVNFLIESGKLNFVKFLINRDYYFTKTLEYAIKSGDMNMLKFIHDKLKELNISNELMFDSSLCLIPIRLDYNMEYVKECLKYLYDNGFYWDFNLVSCAIDCKRNEIVKWMCDNQYEFDFQLVCECAASCDNIDIVKYVIDKCGNGILTKYMMNCAVINQNTMTVEFLCDNKCPMDETTFDTAFNINDHCIENFNEILWILLKNKCGYNLKTVYHAAFSGYFHKLQKWKNIGLPFDKWVMLNAVWGDNVDCLDYLWQINCPRDKFLYAFAVKSNSIKCVKYLEEHNCQKNEQSYSELTEVMQLFENDNLVYGKSTKNIGLRKNILESFMTITIGNDGNYIIHYYYHTDNYILHTRSFWDDLRMIFPIMAGTAGIRYSS